MAAATVRMTGRQIASAATRCRRRRSRRRSPRRRSADGERGMVPTRVEHELFLELGPLGAREPREGHDDATEAEARVARDDRRAPTAARVARVLVEAVWDARQVMDPERDDGEADEVADNHEGKSHGVGTIATAWCGAHGVRATSRATNGAMWLRTSRGCARYVVRVIADAPVDHSDPFGAQSLRLFTRGGSDEPSVGAHDAPPRDLFVRHGREERSDRSRRDRGSRPGPRPSRRSTCRPEGGSGGRRAQRLRARSRSGA